MHVQIYCSSTFADNFQKRKINEQIANSTLKCLCSVCVSNTLCFSTRAHTHTQKFRLQLTMNVRPFVRSCPQRSFYYTHFNVLKCARMCPNGLAVFCMYVCLCFFLLLAFLLNFKQSHFKCVYRCIGACD